MKMKSHVWLAICGLFAGITLVRAGGDRPTEYTNTNSVINTRHNFTFSSTNGTDLLFNGPNIGGNGDMTGARITNYGEVCVFCHTPHGANATVAAPLWNRRIISTSYTTYGELNSTTLTQTVFQPGAASLSCLSCHDGQQAIDAILNMPSSGYYSADPTNSFLDTWRNDRGLGNGSHMHLKQSQGCLACHSPTGTGEFFEYATDFTVGFIGTDLRNDHPVGVTFPSANGSGTDWNTPTGTREVAGRVNRFFDETPNGRLDKNEVRLYDSGNGASVECASCHDPHGVPSVGPGSQFLPTFLRKTNVGSALCLTCHAK